MSRVIFRNNFEELLLELKQDFRVIAPIEKHPGSTSKIIFDEYQRNDILSLFYPVTVLPPKELFLPARDVLFEIKAGNAKTPPLPKRTIIFGLSIEDLEGISHLRTIFTKPIRDCVFTNRAENITVIAVDHFSPPKNIPFDVYFQKISTEEYLVFAGSAIGQRILKSKYFKTKQLKASRVIKKTDQLVGSKILGLALGKSREHPIWAKLEKDCFACGICSFVCPLCYCFETSDEINLPTKKELNGQRVRTWSTCFSEDFANTAAHNFRPKRGDRIYNWYYHKFVRMPREYGFSGCVDCNRCVVFCPAKINYRNTLEIILRDFMEKKQ